jgi:CubicO group peptidase (beta-lactamase class C family)
MTRLAYVFTAVAVVMVGVMLFLAKDAEAPPLLVPLAAGPSQPRVSLTEAGMDPAAVEQAAAWAMERNSTALVVVRAGHVVFERYRDGTTFESAVDPGFTPVLAALLTGSALDDRLINNLDRPVANYLSGAGDAPPDATVRELLAGDRADLTLAQSTDLLAQVLETTGRLPYQSLVAERLWKPMGGGDLEFRVRDNARRPGGVSAACCVRARIADWMRIGELLANRGVFEGNQYAPPRYVDLVLAPVRKDSPRGYFTRVDGEFAAPGVAWLEGTRQQRLWIVPSLRLVILRLGSEAPSSKEWDERMIPDTIIRAVRGWKPASAGEGVDPGKFAPH